MLPVTKLRRCNYGCAERRACRARKPSSPSCHCWVPALGCEWCSLATFLPKCARARTRSVAARTHDRVDSVCVAADANNTKMFPTRSIVAGLLAVIFSTASAFQNEGEEGGCGG